jgi:hypothetical protein
VGLADWFQTFCIDLQVQNTTTISSRYKLITQRLNTDFWNTSSDTAHSLYVGSYGRNTAIDGFSDLDVLFRMPYSLYEQYDKHLGNGQSALLQATKESIKRTYASTDVGADGQVVEIPFTDGIIFQIVPAFINKDDSFTFPDANGGGRWRITNPRPEIEALKNRGTGTNLIHLCRMARAWKGHWAVPMGGLLLDTLAYQFIENYLNRDKSYFYYDFLCRDFFKWVSEQDEKQEFWKAPGSAQHVHSKGLFQYKAKRCHNLALEAIEHENANPKRERGAKAKWREIFGLKFPD